jgi:arsenate reductase (thioredoxin)
MPEIPVVLFLCTHNAGRSLAASVLLDHYAQGRVDVRSAGSEPAAELNPAVVAALRERGLDPSREFPKPLTDDIAGAADVIVSMGCGDTCQFYPGKRYIDWDLEDPAGKPVASVRPIVDDIDRRVQALLAELVPNVEIRPVEIRPYEPRDQTGFADLVAAILGEYGFHIDAILDADLEHPDTSYQGIWLAVHNDRVVGSVAVRLLNHGMSAELKRMYLQPEHRGRGLGHTLLSHAVQWTRDRGCRSVVLDTSTDMTTAQHLYESAGFVRTGTRTETGAHDSRCEILYRLDLA